MAIELSLCFTTYNPREDFYEHIIELLSVDNNEYDIIISDNKSENDVFRKICDINDPRLKIFIQPENRGSINNFVTTLAKADGRYAMFVIDKDKLDIKYLNETIEILKGNNFSGGFFELDRNVTRYKIKNYKTSFCSFLEFAYLTKHPTGYFFNTKLMKEINIMQKFSTPEQAGDFPFEFIITELALCGNLAKIINNFCTTTKLVPGKNTFLRLILKRMKICFLLQLT